MKMIFDVNINLTFPPFVESINIHLFVTHSSNCTKILYVKNLPEVEESLLIVITLSYEIISKRRTVNRLSYIILINVNNNQVYSDYNSKERRTCSERDH